MEVAFIKAVPYTSKKHVAVSDKGAKSSQNDVEIQVSGKILAFSDPGLKFKNNKLVSVKAGKEPFFTVKLKPSSSATKAQKKIVKDVNKELKKKAFKFGLEPADLSKAVNTEIITNSKKTKVTKVVVEINGVTIKLSKKDFTYQFNENGTVTISGKGNFMNSVTK